MTSISSALLGGYPGISQNKTAKSNFGRTEFIAEPEKKKQEKSAALAPTSEIQQAAATTGTKLEQLHQAAQAQTAFTTQLIAQSEEQSPDPLKSSDDPYKAAVEQFEEYMEKTPEERWFEAFLKEQGMSQEEFDVLPPEEKLKLMEKFEDYVEREIEEAKAEKQLKEKLDIEI